jgi:hypothetical protein
MKNYDIKYILIIGLTSIHFNLIAQDYFGAPRMLNTTPIEAPGVERVGAVPLPIESYNNVPLNRMFENDNRETKFPVHKGSYETTYFSKRMLYLNGENINSIRNEVLENVNVNIDENGNIHIEGPQYEVRAEQSFHPLLPKELPKFKKDNIYEQLPMNQGSYSKQTGQAVSSGVEAPPPMAKEIIPEINSQPKIPPVSMDGTPKQN